MEDNIKDSKIAESSCEQPNIQKKKEKIRNFFFKKRNSHPGFLRKYEPFFISFIFTYVITILFVVVVVFKQFEDVMSLIHFEGNLLDFMNEWPHLEFLETNNLLAYKNKIGFSFGYCSTVSPYVYLIAKIVESLLPTTLTLCGMTLVTHSKRKSSKTYATLLMALFSIIMIGMFLMVAKVISVMKFYIFILFVLFSLSIILTASLESKKETTEIKHKNEASDGRFNR